MNLTLSGHDYKYAVEQILLMMYPKERPVYAPPDDGLSAEVALRDGRTFVVAFTRITMGDKTYTGSERINRLRLTNKLTKDRLLQKIIKLSFYKAAVAHTGIKPVWGALTGIRPGKIATNLMAYGATKQEAAEALMQEYFVSPERAALCADTAEAGLRVKHALGARDIALYVGIPFCPTRCHYCSFVSHSVEKSSKLIAPFVEALLEEIDAVSAMLNPLGLNIVSIYIGGGTPTTLSAEQLDRVMASMGTAFDLSNVREYTVEAGRPDTITPEKLAVLRRHGASRVSINPQSMSNDVLESIGRCHTAEDILTSFEQARESGFTVINTDLIAGLPGDTPDGFTRSLEAIVRLRPENITVHTLALKKGTSLKLDGAALPDAQAVGQMLDASTAILSGAGYVPYYLYRQKFMSGGFENVGWSLPGHENLYNILIMEELGTIIALGGGGVTKLVSAHGGRIERVFNYKYPYEYVRDIGDVIAKKGRIAAFYANETATS